MGHHLGQPLGHCALGRRDGGGKFVRLGAFVAQCHSAKDTIFLITALDDLVVFHNQLNEIPATVTFHVQLQCFA